MKAVVAIALAMLGLVISAPALATTCGTTVTSEPIAFGSYNPITGGEVEIAGSVNISCDGETPYEVTIDGGANATSGQRRMSNGVSAYLSYDLFSNPGRTSAWTDTTSVPGVSTTPTMVYGRIPGSQTTVIPGEYSDSLNVTVSY